MRKIPLRIRLVLITTLVMITCCLAIYFSVLNSALLQLDSLQAGMVSMTTGEDTDIIMDFSLSDIFPEISTYVADAKADFIRQSLLLVILVLAVGALATFFASRYVLKPIRELSQAVSETTEHNLYTSLKVPEARDEVRDLAESFNDMKLRLDQAFSTQKQFTANAAHELRTPLAVMQTGLEVFQKKPDKDVRDYEETMQNTLTQLERMNHLVNTLLDFQSMNTLPIQDQTCLADLAEEACCDLQPLAQEKNIQLEYQAETEAQEDTILCNETLIYQAIYNLVENAIKYNREGGKVEVLVIKKGEHLNLTVKDNGIGIPKEQWDHVFDPFYRVDKSRSRKTGGVGLGLAMVKEAAAIHKGRVWIENSTPDGTSFCLEI